MANGIEHLFPILLPLQDLLIIEAHPKVFDDREFKVLLKVCFSLLFQQAFQLPIPARTGQSIIAPPLRNASAVTCRGADIQLPRFGVREQ